MKDVMIPFAVYMLPAMLLFYLASEIFQRDRKSTRHKLAAGIIFFFHMWLAAEFLISLLPPDAALSIKVHVAFPSVLASNALSFLFFQRLTENRSEKAKWLVWVGICPLALLYLANLQGWIYAGMDEQGMWKKEVPGPVFSASVVILVLYSISFMYFLREKCKHSPDPEKRQYVLLMFGVTATILFIAVTTLIQSYTRIVPSVWPDVNAHGVLIMSAMFWLVVVKYPFLPPYGQLYQALFRKSPVSSLIVDGTGVIMNCNPAFEQLTGYTEDNLVRKNFASLLKESHRGLFAARLENWLNEVQAPMKRVNLLDASGRHRLVTLDSEYVENGQEKIHFLIVQDETEQHNEVEKIRHLAYHDKLTGLGNRRFFEESFDNVLEEVQARQERLACLLVDLDDFKKVNDTLGHQAGDHVLQTVAKRLLSCVRKEDHVIRLGGDEFVVLLSYQQPRAVYEVANRMMERLNAPIDIESGTVWKISPSIGISLYPDHGRDMDTLLQNADKAMYSAKSQGKNQLVFYSELSDTTG